MAKLYLITLDLPKLSHAEQGKIAIAEKVPFLQLRMKNANHLEISQTIEAILPELKRSETKLIVNDHISFIGKYGVAGVHLGQSDYSVRPFDELRVTKPKNNDKNNVMLNSAYTELIEVSKHENGKNILGITANTNADIENAIKYGSSYIGLGPFQYTTTKSNLAKTLGVQGIKVITDKYADRIPIFAIGGINLENIDHLADLKLAGVAISSAVFASENPRDAIQKFTQKLDAFAEAIHA